MKQLLHTHPYPFLTEGKLERKVNIREENGQRGGKEQLETGMGAEGVIT